MLDKEVINSLEKIVESEIKKITAKGDITPAEIKNLNDAMCLIEKTTKYTRHMSDAAAEFNAESSQAYGRSMPNTYRIRSARSGAYPDYGMYPLGNRYDGYGVGRSGHSNVDHKIRELEERRMQAATDGERMLIDEWIEELELKR